MAKLRIDLSGTKGLSTGFWGAGDGLGEEDNFQYLSEDGSFNSGTFNPFRRIGLYSPAIGAVKDITASSSFDEVIGSTEIDNPNNDFYMAERSTAIFKGDGFEDNELSEVHDVSGATMTDLQIYQVNGSEKLFYAYQKTGGGDIGAGDLPLSSENDDLFSTDATGGTSLGATNEIIMEVSDNGFMYVGDGNVVHKFDGTTEGGSNGTVSANELTFPAPFQITDLLDYRGNLLIALVRSTESFRSEITSDKFRSNFAGVYFWDRRSGVRSSVDFVPIEGIRTINKLFSLEGELHAITVSPKGLTEIRKWNRFNFQLVRVLPLDAEPIFRDSISVTTDIVKWVSSKGDVWWYGRVTPSSPRKIYRVGNIQDLSSDNNSGGAIAIGAEGTLTSSNAPKPSNEGMYVGIRTGSSTYKVKRWFPFGAGILDSVNQTTVSDEAKTKVYPLPKLSFVNNVTIFFQATANDNNSTTTDWTVKLYKNMKTSSEVSFDIATDESNKGYFYKNLSLNNVNFIQLSLSHSGDIFNNDTDPLPIFAEIEYTPTEKLD